MTTMLIVDDSRLSRVLIKNIVVSAFPEWEFIEAASGDEALQKVQGNKIDIMTIDYNMPGMDGLTLCESLTKSYPSAKISLLTANIQDAIRTRANELGISFLSKPITEDGVLSFVK